MSFATHFSQNVVLSTQLLYIKKTAMKKLFLLCGVLLLTASLSFAQQGPPPPHISIEVIVGSRPPNTHERSLMAAEEANHPNIAQSMHDMENAMKHLNAAPDNFGGHKGQAQADIRQAWISLRKALYYRLYADTH